MDFQLIIWLAKVGLKARLAWIEAQQTHQHCGYAVFTAQGLDSRGLHSATLWREI